MEVFSTHLWKSAIVITLFYGFYKLFLQKETYFQSIRYFLIAGILCSLLIPFITIIKHIEIVPIQELVVNMTNIPAQTKNASIDWPSIGVFMYASVAIGLFIKFTFQLVSIGLLIYKNGYRVANGSYLVETGSPISPFSFFRFVVYNPIQFEPKELKQVLAHEKAHVLQMHSIDKLLSNILAILLWFNPFVWLYKKNIEQNLEFIADEYAQSTTESHSYQELLLKTTIPNYQIALANNFYNSLLKKRIIMLHKKRSNNKSQLKFVFILPFLLAFVLVFNTKTIAQQTSSTQKAVKATVEIFAMALSKESSKDDLKNISSTFLDKGLTVKFSNIKRNSKNEITAINIDAKAKSGKASASYASNLENGINPIQISFDRANNNLNIGAQDQSDIGQYSYTQKGTGNSFVFISNDDDNNTRVIKERTKKIIVETDFDEDEDENHYEDVIKISTKKGGKENKIILNSGNKNKKPLFILDGKEITAKEMEALDSDTIKSIDVLKGTKAIEKYGKKGKDGVIVIVSK